MRKLAMRLNSEFIGSVRDRVEKELEACREELGLEAACREALQLVARGEASSADTAIVERFFRIIWLFENCQDPASIPRSDLEDLSRMAEYSLRLMDIKPYSSYLSYLHGSFLRAKGRMLAGNDDAFQAAWNFNLAESVVGVRSQALSEDFSSHWDLAEYHHQLGFVAESLESYRKAEELATNDEDVARARLGMIRCLRIFGEVETALVVADSVKLQFKPSLELHAMLEWERRLLVAQRDGDVAGLISAMHAAKRRRSASDAHYLILASLWCYASRQRSAIAELPRSEWIKRHLGASRDRRTLESLSYLAMLEKCYATGSDAERTDIFDKLKTLGAYLAQLRKGDPTVEMTVLLAGLARWLLRVKQRGSAVLVVNEYQRCSHLLSQGRSSTLFGLLDDLGDKLNASGESARAGDEVRTLKTGMERTFLYVEIFAKLTMSLVALKTGNWLGTKSPEAVRQELAVKLSRYFMEYAAGGMKGPIHKFAQIMLNSFPLPPEAAENFKAVLWSKQVMPEKAMRKVFEQDVGKKIEEVFSEFDFTPIGVGSVAQVYRARLESGEEVAVKIQFPELDKVVEQDMAMFSRIFTAVRWVLPAFDVMAIKQLLQDLVEREIDFRDEAKTYETLREVSARTTRWTVPKIYPELSTRRVLTTEYVRGLNFYQFNETATPDERLTAACAISDFATRSVLDAGMVCIDPHPANMILSNGKVYLIDFGFFVKASPGFIRLYRQLVSYYGPLDEALIDRVYVSMQEAGLVKASHEVPLADIRDFLGVLCQKLNWETCADPQVQARFLDLFLKKGVNQVFGSSDPEFFVSFIGQCQVFRTINKFGVPQPDYWEELLGLEMAGGKADAPSQPLPAAEREPADDEADHCDAA
jgi:predicted unusual protein kinase regulating ubiquinone biosynthesis (AarF/ABC1/UbiB family)